MRVGVRTLVLPGIPSSSRPGRADVHRPAPSAILKGHGRHPRAGHLPYFSSISSSVESTRFLPGGASFFLAADVLVMDKGEDRRFDACGDVDLFHQVGEMGFHRTFGDTELVADCAIRSSMSDESEDLSLSPG